VKAGDLIRFVCTEPDGNLTRYITQLGLVVQMSKTGHDTESAQVLFNDGETWWVDTQRLEIVNESR